jgi:hypothetical protein
VTLLVRSEANSQPLVAAVRSKIAEVDPSLSVSATLSMEEVRWLIRSRNESRSWESALPWVPPSEIVRHVLGQGLRLTVLEFAIGVAASVLLARLLTGLLFGVRALDPTAFSVAALVLFGAASLACYLPARPATRQDPIAVLRFQ